MTKKEIIIKMLTIIDGKYTSITINSVCKCKNINENLKLQVMILMMLQTMVPKIEIVQKLVFPLANTWNTGK